MNEDTDEKGPAPLFNADEHGFEPDNPEHDDTDVDRADRGDLDLDIDTGTDIDLSESEGDDDIDRTEDDPGEVHREVA